MKAAAALKKRIALALALGLLALLPGCGKAPAPGISPEEEPEALSEVTPAVEDTALSESELIEKIVLLYARYGGEAAQKNAELLERLRASDPDAAARWEAVLALWESVDQDLEIHSGCLPEGLPDTDELCLVVLGFQLNPDGSMRDELVERLRVALKSAERYPHAYIVCTGGGTAAANPSATEAGAMAAYLIEHGVDAQRILVEDRSQTTAQNAAYTCAILAEQCPRVHQLAIISSDYHIATGVLLFSAQAILTAEEPGREAFTVVSNAAWPAPSGSLSPMFQAGALIELAGNTETAYDIYYDTYDIHALPPLGDAP